MCKLNYCSHLWAKDGGCNAEVAAVLRCKDGLMTRSCDPCSRETLDPTILPEFPLHNTMEEPPSFKMILAPIHCMVDSGEIQLNRL